MAVKRRNIESRYWLEYLRMSFQPECQEDRQRFGGWNYYYSTSYIELLCDQLPYYNKHNPDRCMWLKDLLTNIANRWEQEDYDMDNWKEKLGIINKD